VIICRGRIKRSILRTKRFLALSSSEVLGSSSYNARPFRRGLSISLFSFSAPRDLLLDWHFLAAACAERNSFEEFIYDLNRLND
jgi:hypothetical protein